MTGYFVINGEPVKSLEQLTEEFNAGREVEWFDGADTYVVEQGLRTSDPRFSYGDVVMIQGVEAPFEEWNGLKFLVTENPWDEGPMEDTFISEINDPRPDGLSGDGFYWSTKNLVKVDK